MANFDRALNRIFMTDAFWGAVSINVDKSFNTKIPTAGVRVKPNSIDVELVINPNYWDSLTIDKQVGLIKHELSHLTFFHLWNFGDNLAVDNIAKDIVVNQYIKKSELPPDGVNLETFPELNLPPGKDFPYYYKALMDALPKNKKLQDMVKNIQDMKNYDVEPGDGGDGGFAQDQFKNILKRVIEEDLKRDRGLIPGQYHSIIDKLDEKIPDKMNWKSVVRNFASFAKSIRINITRNKMHKRLGFDYPGINIKRKTKILLGIDTSGSVSDLELTEFLKQIHLIYKTGIEITVVECDAKMYEPWVYNGKFKEFTFKGRGGTSFDPVLEFFMKGEYNGLIYFTDGGCSTNMKITKKVLWVVTPKGILDFHAPGLKIRIEE